MGIITNPLDDVLSSLAKVRLMRLFSLDPQPMSAREAARRVGLAKRSADLGLRDLVQVGVILRRGLGPQQMYVLSPHHALVRHAILPMFRGTGSPVTETANGGEQGAIDEFFSTLRDAVEVPDRNAVEWAAIFGSTAHGTDTPESDIDIGVIVTDAKALEPMRTRLANMLPIIRRGFGRVLSPVVMTVEQAHGLAATGHQLISAIAEGRVVSTKYTNFAEVFNRKD